MVVNLYDKNMTSDGTKKLISGGQEKVKPVCVLYYSKRMVMVDLID